MNRDSYLKPYNQNTAMLHYILVQKVIVWFGFLVYQLL